MGSLSGSSNVKHITQGTNKVVQTITIYQKTYLMWCKQTKEKNKRMRKKINIEKGIMAENDYDGTLLNWSNKKYMVCFLN